MKYFYIICLVLSSLFTYKYSSAQTNLRYAFFIPDNAFQQVSTTEPDIQLMRPRYPKQKKQTQTQPAAVKRKPVIKKVALPKVEPEETVISQTAPTVADKPQEPTKTDSSIAQIASQYKLDEPTSIPTAKEESQPEEELLSQAQQLELVDVDTLLSRLPFPDYNQPKFKQLYGIYGLELKSLDQHNKLPNNPEQEETLAKANSLLRFKVK